VACNISISALSRSIRQLEQDVGVRLFDRDNRSVSLTHKGQQFLQYAKTATRQWRVICNELKDDRDDLQGELSLYCSVTASHSILFDLLNRLRNRVVAGHEEIAIAALPGSPPGGVLLHAITESPLVFIAAQQIDVPKTTATTKHLWADVPMILSEGGIARSRVNLWFKDGAKDCG